MGVAGSGKSTVGALLSDRLGLPFLEGDALHSPANILKMSRGEPLEDADRAPWLGAIAARLSDDARYPRGLVVSCSALKAAYRHRLRAAAAGVRFVFLAISPQLASTRVAARTGHFMPARLIGDQFATLEVPTAQEPDVVQVDASLAPSALLAAILTAVLPGSD